MCFVPPLWSQCLGVAWPDHNGAWVLGAKALPAQLNQPISIKYPVRRVSIAVGKYMMIVMYERLSTSETTASFAGA